MAHPNLLLNIGPAFKGKRVQSFSSYAGSYIKYLYQDSEGFDTGVGSFVGFPAAVEAGAGVATPGLFLSTLPGFPSAPGTLVQLPKVLRIFPDANSGIWPNDFYPRLLRDLGGMIETATAGTLHGINVQTGYSSNPDNPADDPRWLLQAVPNTLDPDPSHVVGGKVFVIVCVAEAFPFYHTAVAHGPTPTYLADYARFVAKYPRFEKFGGLILHYNTGDPAIDAQCALHLLFAFAGIGGYPTGLSTYGWNIISGTNVEASASFWPYVRNFFGL